MKTVPFAFAALALALAGAALAGAALADARPASSPDLATLPEGAIGAPPVVPAPPRIAATEKVPGFYLVKHERPARGKKHAGVEYLQLFATEEEAKAAAHGGGGQRRGEVCFAEELGGRALKGPRTADEAPEEARWTSPQPSLSFPLTREAGARTGARAVHAERLVASGESAQLESTDVWVDPETRGVRLIGRTTVPLRLLTAVPNGPRVWAMRERDRLQIVVTEDPQMLARGENLFVVTSRGLDESSGCTHLRTSLRLQRGEAESASILAAVQLDPLERGEARAAKAPTELRIRPLRIHTSVSWTSRDAAPVLALSLGWEARARSQPGDADDAD